MFRESPGYPGFIMLPDPGILATCFLKICRAADFDMKKTFSVVVINVPDYKLPAMIEQIFVSEV